MPKTSEAAKEARRTQILDAAVRCFARTGYYATTIEDVVRETGLSRGALYLYFPSKEALYLAISERWNCEVEAQARILMATLHGLMVQWHRQPGSIDWHSIAEEIVRGLRADAL